MQTEVETIIATSITEARQRLQQFLNTIDITKVAQMLHSVDSGLHFYTVIYVVEDEDGKQQHQQQQKV